MAYNGGKEITNSFNLELTNLNGQIEQEVNLFRLGGVSANPVTTPRPNNYIVQSLELFRPQFLVLSPAVTNKDVILLYDTTFDFENGAGHTITTSTIINGSNINDINDKIQTTLNTSPSAWSGISIYLVYDFALGVGSGGFPMVAYIFYDEDFDLSTLSTNGVVGMSMTSSAGTLTISDISTSPTRVWKTGVKGEGSGVLITPRNGIAYGEILESQIGQVLDIKAMNFTISATSTAPSIIQQEQVYNCFTFEKKDINGNTIEYKKCPVVDVYSNPNINAIDDIQLERKADVYTLDGTTNLNYTLRAGIVVQLSAEYTRLN